MRNRSFGARLLSTCLALLLTLTPTLVFADVETAQEYYRQASEAYQNGDLERAADLLERAYAEDPNLVYQYNRILALKGMSRFKQALRVLEIYENPMKDDEQNRFSDIEEIKSDLEAAIEKKNAEPVDGDGTDGDGDGTDGDVKEGDGSDGDKDGDGDGKEEPEPAEGSSWVAYTLLGSGVVATGLGILFGSGVLVSDELDRASCASDNFGGANSGEFDSVAAFTSCGYAPTIQTDNSFTQFTDLEGQYEDDVDAIGTQQVLAGVFIGTGAALLIAGGVALLVSSPESESGARASAQTPTVKVAPYVSLDGFGGALEVTF